MLFQSRVFSVPKDYETPQYYEDASAVNTDAGRVAIADGVSSAVFSGAWAQILTRSVVADPPNVQDSTAFAAWLVERRKEWAAGVNVPSLPYHLLMKLRQVGGGFATLAWIDVERMETSEGTDPEYLVRGRGVGDSCVFHVRDGQLLEKWPMTASADFDADPISIGSVNFQRDQALVFQEFEWTCQTGDLIVLATDAISAWYYRMLEAGEAVNWEDLSHIPDTQLSEYWTSLRESHWLKRDDSTIVFLGLGREVGFLDLPKEPEVIPGVIPATHSDELPAGEVIEAVEPVIECDSVGPVVIASTITCATILADANPIDVPVTRDDESKSQVDAEAVPVPQAETLDPELVDPVDSPPIATETPSDSLV